MLNRGKGAAHRRHIGSASKANESWQSLQNGRRVGPSASGSSSVPQLAHDSGNSRSPAADGNARAAFQLATAVRRMAKSNRLEVCLREARTNAAGCVLTGMRVRKAYGSSQPRVKGCHPQVGHESRASCAVRSVRRGSGHDDHDLLERAHLLDVQQAHHAADLGGRIWAQWWPARTATPWRSRISDTSWGWTPSSSKEMMPSRSTVSVGPKIVTIWHLCCRGRNH